MGAAPRCDAFISDFGITCINVFFPYDLKFLFICYFVVPSAAVGKYKKLRLTDEIKPTAITIINNTNTPIY